MMYAKNSRPPRRPAPTPTPPAPLPGQDKVRTARSGGIMKESKAMMRKEVAFMKKKGAPKSMIKHEEREMKGAKKMRMGGMSYSKGGSTGGSYRKGADGIASKGKTKGKQIKMRMGGMC